MSRFKTEAALVLHVRAFGESNREAVFLTAASGIVRAAVYGGPKSKLRAFVSPFHSGTLYLYHDPVRGSFKVTDFDVGAWRPGLRENYERTMAACAISEAILAGHGGGGNSEEALELAEACLDALEAASGEAIERALVFFLWHWSGRLGVRPDFSEPEESRNFVSRALRNSEAMRYLDSIDSDTRVGKTECSKETLRYAKEICLDILAAAFGRRLRNADC